jgi:Kdo2-lipid IVA lauroyltransferase/acyltransferase
LGYPVDAAYKPIRDPRGERLLLELRSRSGARLVPAKDVLPIFAPPRRRARARDECRSGAGAGGAASMDALSRSGHGVLRRRRANRARDPAADFLRLDAPLRRGYYEVEFTQLWDGRERTEPGALTERYARACEADVLARPADWLWTYRRWRFAKAAVRRAVRRGR